MLARSYCAKHYYRWRKYGTVEDIALHHQWGGGTLDKNGYRIVRVNGKARPEHHIVMEVALGRALHPWESIHHRNGIRDDNSLSNLELWATAHRNGQRVDDLVRWVVDSYSDLVSAVLKSPASDGANPVPDPNTPAA